MPEDVSNGEEKEPQGETLFNKMSEAIPPRDDTALDEVTEDEHGTIGERMEGSPKLTDVQVIDKRLFPDLGIPWLNNLQMARVFPEYYVYLKRIMVKHLVRTHGMFVAQAMAVAEVAVGIPIDGEGRIDAIAIMGRAAEAEETKAKNEVGL